MDGKTFATYHFATYHEYDIGATRKCLLYQMKHIINGIKNLKMFFECEVLSEE